jgi:hypothetical protein
MTIRSFSNAFEVIDQTQSLSRIPQAWTLLGDSGLFSVEPITTRTVSFQEINGSLAVVNDQFLGSKPQTQSNDLRKIHTYSTTYHPIVDALYPQDLTGKSAYNDLSVADTEAAAMLRKMTKIKKSFAVSREIARFKTLGTGQPWAPNGTISTQSFYTDFGKTRNEVDFALNNSATDVISKCEAIIAGFQSAANDGEVITGVTAYCSTAFFSKLVAHAKTTQAYTYQMSFNGNNNITQDRAGGMGLYRRFNFGGILFLEVPTILAGTTLVTAGDAIFVANGVDDAFVTYVSPANRFGYENTFGELEYMWTFKDPRLTEITIEAEMSMLNVIKKPEMLARGYTA